MAINQKKIRSFHICIELILGMYSSVQYAGFDSAIVTKRVMWVLCVFCGCSEWACVSVTLTVLPSASQWPTGPWTRPILLETQRLPGPTKCHRGTWRGSRTLQRQLGWSTRSVTMATNSYQKKNFL